MNIEASSIHASPVSQPGVPLVSAPPLDISHHDETAVPGVSGYLTEAESSHESFRPVRFFCLVKL